MIINLTSEEIGSAITQQLRVTLDKDELAKMLAQHLVVESTAIEPPTLEVYPQTDRYNQVTGYYFIFTAETE